MQSTIRKHLSLAKVNSTMSIIINNWRMDPSLNALIHCETGETRRLGEYHFILLEKISKKMPMWFYRDLIYVPKYGRTALSAETACRRRSMRCALLSMMMANNRTLLKQFRRKVTYAIKSMCLCRTHRLQKKLIITDQIQETVPEEISSTTPPVPVRKKT